MIGDWEPVATLDPYAATTAGDRRLARLLFEPLWQFGPDLTPLPGLADRIPTPADGGVRVAGSETLVDIRLAPGRLWSDGEPITADDVVFTAGAVAVAGLNRVEKRSDVEVVWHLAGVRPDYLQLGSSMFVLPRHVFAAVPAADLAAALRRPAVASGPFVLASEVAGSELLFRANPRYAAGRSHAAYLDAIAVREYVGKTSEIAALTNGEADLGFHLQASDASDLAGATAAELNVTTGLEGEVLAINHAAGPWADDRGLLDALVGTIDRDALNRAAFAGAAKPTPGLFPAPLGLTVPSVPPPSPTPGAKREAEFSLLIPCDDAVRRQEADTLSAEWSAVGARVAISCRAPVDLYGASGLLPAGRFEMALYAYPWPADPSGWAPFGTSAGSQNWSHCSDPAIDSAFAAGMATLDARKRREAYLAGARAWLAYHCSVPLFDRPEAVERAARLHNFVANPVAGAETWNAADWWLSS